ncbi:MAG: uridine diphosphate-N-acetylglucosamine-binding protein YvcK [Bryobacterales bacterium]
MRIVALGGGTGLSTILRGLKRLSHGQFGEARSPDAPFLEIGAVVTVSDDGGSSGRLRRALDILATGDIRNCMVALAEDELLLSQLFQYRFSSGRGLRGHSFGNLFLAALTHITGDFHQAIQLSSEVLAIHGHIFPSTLKNVQLVAEMAGGRKLVGESRITRSPDAIRAVRLKPRHCPPLPDTLEAIARADLITLGPGSLYTSVIPNLLVEGIPDAIVNSPARKVYLCNMMGQPGETIGYSASQHVQAILEHARARVIDSVILNDRRVSTASRRRYAAQSINPVKNDASRIERLGVKVLTHDVLGEGTEARVRHDPDRTASLLVELARQARAKKLGAPD